MAKELKYNNGEPIVVEYAKKCYELPTASKTQLGGVKVGKNLTITSDGILSVSADINFNNLPTYYNTDDVPTAKDYLNLGLYNKETNEIYFRIYNKYGYENGSPKSIGDVGLGLDLTFGSDNTLSFYNSVDEILTIKDLDANTTLSTVSDIRYPQIYYVDKTFFIYRNSNILYKHDIATGSETQLTYSGFNLGTSLSYGEKYSNNKYRMFNTEGLGGEYTLSYFEYDSNTNTITLLDTQTIDDPSLNLQMNCLGVINFNKGEYLFFFRASNSSAIYIYIYYYNGTTLTQLTRNRIGTTAKTTLSNVYKNNNTLLLSGGLGFGNYEFNMDTKTLSVRQGTTTEIETGFDTNSVFNFNNTRFIKAKNVGTNGTAYIPTNNPYEYTILEVTSTSAYSLESLNAVMLTSEEQLTYQIPINKWYQFIDDLINKDGTTLTINDVTYSNFIAKEDNTLISKNCIINLMNYTISISK